MIYYKLVIKFYLGRNEIINKKGSVKEMKYVKTEFNPNNFCLDEVLDSVKKKKKKQKKKDREKANKK
jgi:hypothetical protein